MSVPDPATLLRVAQKFNNFLLEPDTNLDTVLAYNLAIKENWIYELL